MNPRPVIWFAIVMSTVIYLVIAMQLASGGEPAAVQELARNQYVNVFYGVALASFVAGWFVVPRVVKGNAQTRMIVALAVFESCAILGLITAILTKDWRVYLAPWALALIGFIREFPRAAAGEPPAPV